MTEIKLALDEQGQGTFKVYDDGKEMGIMAVSVADGRLTVYHTEVLEEGKGYAKQLLDAMVNYARVHHLKVVPLCPYVQAQFKKHNELYADILASTHKN